jgi:peptidyl-prolyl cis-trans isomerase B (cyclophilin B)
MNKYLILPLLIVTFLAGCSLVSNQPKSETKPVGELGTINSTNPSSNNFPKPVMTNTATIKTTKGDIVVELYGNEAPKAVANFIKLANEKFYDGIYFHRVIADFMIQTGDPQAKGEVGKDFVYDANNNPKRLPIAGTGGPGYQFEDEFNASLRFDKPGVLAMANSGPNTNGSQFFITHVATEWLNDKHTIFGQVTSGQDIVNAIQQGDKIVNITVN